MRTSSRHLISLLLASTIGVTAACGADTETAPGEGAVVADPGRPNTTAGVVEVLDALTAALAHGDGARACALLSAEAQRRLERSRGTQTCVDAVVLLRREMSDPQRARLAGSGGWSIEIDAGAAGVTGPGAEVLAGALGQTDLLLVRVEERWAIA